MDGGQRLGMDGCQWRGMDEGQWIEMDDVSGLMDRGGREWMKIGA